MDEKAGCTHKFLKDIVIRFLWVKIFYAFLTYRDSKSPNLRLGKWIRYMVHLDFET